MAYSVDALKTVAECDAVLEAATEEKKDLNVKKVVLDNLVENTSDSNKEVSNELAVLAARIAGLKASIAVLPDGATKDDELDKLKRAEHSEYLLQRRQIKRGAPAVLSRELELEMITRSLAAIDDFTAAVTTRKAAL
jgi:hypothetical protein